MDILTLIAFLIVWECSLQCGNGSQRKNIVGKRWEGWSIKHGWTMKPVNHHLPSFFTWEEKKDFKLTYYRLQVMQLSRNTRQLQQFLPMRHSTPPHTLPGWLAVVVAAPWEHPGGSILYPLSSSRRHYAEQGVHWRFICLSYFLFCERRCLFSSVIHFCCL